MKVSVYRNCFSSLEMSHFRSFFIRFVFLFFPLSALYYTHAYPIVSIPQASFDRKYATDRNTLNSFRDNQARTDDFRRVEAALYR